jgi:PilZ domain
MAAEPSAGYELIIRDQNGSAHRAVATAVTPGRIAFRFIEDRSGQFGLDERLLVTWPDDASLVCLPVLVDELPDEFDDAWLVRAVGDPWREQRRRYIRAAISGTVWLRLLGANVAEGIPAELIDLSEAGLRCAIDPDHLELGEPDALLSLILEVPGDQFEMTGRVLYARPVAREDGRPECVVVFDRPVPQVEVLRQHVNGEGQVASTGAALPMPAHPA